MDTARNIDAGEHVYLVSRTLRIVPGRPYVVGELAAGILEEAPGGLEVFTASEMRSGPGLSEALERWRKGDDSLPRRDAAALEDVKVVPLRSAAERRAREMHPSRIARRWSMQGPG